jgi:nitroreductase
MDVIECIKSRMSIRKYKHEPVPKELLEKIIDMARWSPSYKNSQPWEVVVISGEKKKELSEFLVGLLEKGEEPCPDMPEPDSWPPAIEARISELMQKRCEISGIDMSAPDVRKKAKIANFRFYGAPHGIFLFQDAGLTPWSILDIGMFSQTLMLAAHACGLGTVPQAFLTDYAMHVKKFLGVPQSKRLVLGVSVGYADIAAPINSFKPGRAGTAEIAQFVE